MESHYVCTGDCGGVSPVPGTCSAESCSMYQQELKECQCENGEHKKEESKE